MTAGPAIGEREGGRVSHRILVAVVAVAGVLVGVALSLTLLGGDEPGAPAPEAAREEEDAAAEEPTASPGPEETASGEELDELVAAVADDVASLRGLMADDPIEAEFQDPDELADTVAEIAARDRDPEELEIRRRILVTLRLLPDDLDLEATLMELLGEQIAGLYSPEEATLYVRAADADELSPGEEVTLAHEVLHALQDQAFGLERFLDAPDEEPDAGLAAQSLIEGDAVLTQELWSLRHQSEEERAERLDELGEVDTERLEQAPRYVRESLLFPYQEGLSFVRALHEDGGFDAVDAAFDDPPTASAEILEPQRYLDGDGVADVSVPGAPDTDWAPLGDYTYGAFDLRSLIREFNAGGAAELARDWAGGRLRAWERDDDVALTLAVAFREEAVGSQACTTFGQWYSVVADASETEDAGVYEGDRDWAAVRCGGSEVHVGIGPDADTARSLAGE